MNHRLCRVASTDGSRKRISLPSVGPLFLNVVGREIDQSSGVGYRRETDLEEEVTIVSSVVDWSTLDLQHCERLGPACRASAAPISSSPQTHRHDPTLHSYLLGRLSFHILVAEHTLVSLATLIARLTSLKRLDLRSRARSDLPSRASRLCRYVMTCGNTTRIYLTCMSI